MSISVFDGDLPASVVRELSLHRQIAVDTETSGLDWATDQLHLVQLCTPGTGAVLVHRPQQGAECLGSMLADPSVVKVFHFAPFDLGFLAAHGLRVRSVACTKTASRLLRPTAAADEHSLQSLLQSQLGLSVAKGPVRTSDWGGSELSPEQIAYAAEDVHHLLALMAMLQALLTDRGLLGLFEQICAYLPVDAQLRTGGYPDPLRY